MLRLFKESLADIPLATLRSTLKNRPEVIYQMNPRKFEELVGSVFKDFYDCEVKHVGKSHDGGIDLILVRSDHDTIVQVKRRQKTGRDRRCFCYPRINRHHGPWKKSECSFCKQCR